MSPPEPVPLEAIIHRLAAQAPARSTVEAIYQAVLSGLWRQLVPLVGALGARAIFSRAIQVAARQQSGARAITLTEHGPDLRSLDASVGVAVCEAVARALHDALHGLIGPGLLERLVRDVEQDVERWAVAELGSPAEPKRDDRPLLGGGEADDEQ